MSLKLRTAEATPQLEPLVRPRERATTILQQIDHDLAKVKERDHGCWDDQVEVSSALFPQKLLYSQQVIELVTVAACPPLSALFQGFQELTPIRGGFSSAPSGCRRSAKAPWAWWHSALRSSGRPSDHRPSCFARSHRRLSKL